MALMPVDEALARVVQGARRLEAEQADLFDALGRTLAQDLCATRSQPPVDVSQMDGYAVRARDVGAAPTRLRVIGVSAAGRGFDGEVGPGEAVRIFTGARAPRGADAVVMQERARADGDHVEILEMVRAGRFVRPAGLDFREGERLLRAGERLTPAMIALAAAMNHPSVAVIRRPRVAILATGDELVEPGARPSLEQIVASNHLGVAALAREAGGAPVLSPIAPDEPRALAAAIRAGLALRPDALVTIGGASVGEFDLAHAALGAEGMALDFWKIAMRPGKPLIHGRIGEVSVLGLPGNPVSSLVCAQLFLIPLLRAMQGDPHAGADPTIPARLDVDLPANDERRDYLRARVRLSPDGTPFARPLDGQDSSVLRALAGADALIVRPAGAEAAKAGDVVPIVKLKNWNKTSEHAFV